jgi:aryl-alcohol dehydrogenase-like predicted oxidoreductase
MFARSATPAGTARFASRFRAESEAQFFRAAQNLTVSSLGIGTYLGRMDDATDAAYTESIRRALAGGINFIDTSLNYRHQRSERAVSRAIVEWAHEDGGSRDEIVVATKAGYLVPDAIPAGVLRREDIVGGMHSLAPAFLSDQLDRSRRNLGLETVDIFYLHNPETQLSEVAEDVFYARIQAAFELLEALTGTGEIGYYGAATWDGFRRTGPGALSLDRMAAMAREIAGTAHHFRFIQVPVNLAMTEALAGPVLERAAELGITVVASASLLQSRLARGLPDEVAQAMPGTLSDAQRAIQFTRSAPGITVALAGMSKPGHVDENLGIARIRPVPREDFARAFA